MHTSSNHEFYAFAAPMKMGQMLNAEEQRDEDHREPPMVHSAASVQHCFITLAPSPVAAILIASFGDAIRAVNIFVHDQVS